jgi:hypothetical protein
MVFGITVPEKKIRKQPLLKPTDKQTEATLFSQKNKAIPQSFRSGITHFCCRIFPQKRINTKISY